MKVPNALSLGMPFQFMRGQRGNVPLKLEQEIWRQRKWVSRQEWNSIEGISS